MTNFPNEQNDLSTQYLWQLWVLKITGNKKTVFKLFYSWVVPYFLDDKGWQAIKIDYCESFNDIDGKTVKIELLNARYIGLGVIIKKYIEEILRGKLLGEIEVEDKSSFVPDSILNFDLNLKVIKNMFIRPEVLLPIEHLLIPWPSRAIPNPGEYSAFVSQFVNLNKTDVLSFNEYHFENLIIKRIIIGISLIFKSITGFDITKESAPRLGNFEWYRFPVADDDLESLIKFSCKKNGTTTATDVTVYFRPLIKTTKTIFTRCRIFNGEEISLDHIREDYWAESPLTITFSSPQPVSEIKVTVWQMYSHEPIGKIIYEFSYPCIRSINLSTSIIGSRIDSGRLNLLNRLGKGEKNKPEELAKFDRSTHSSESEIGGYERDPWVNAARSSIAFMKKMIPPKSEAKFFLNGWDLEKDASGQLSFVEWMLKLVSGTEKGGLILLDPFFDLDGLEIFANARTTNTQFIVVTCTQQRENNEAIPLPISDGDNELAKESLTKQAARLQAACKSMLPLLNSLDLRIVDLRSLERGNKQLFHDRYIIQTDQEGFPTRGFNLSNSIQGATRKAPVLVTPIPEDVLNSVFSYIEDLISPKLEEANTKKIEIVTVYPITENKDNIDASATLLKNREDDNDLKNIPNSGLLFSKLLNDPLLEKTGIEDLKEALKKNRIFIDGKSGLYLYNMTTEQLTIFAQSLNDSDQEKFNKLIDGLGELRNRSFSSNHDHIDPKNNAPIYDSWNELKSLLFSKNSTGEKLLKYIANFEFSDRLIKYEDRFYQVFNCPTFETAFESSMMHFQHFSYWRFSLDANLSCACDLLVNCYSKKAISFLENLCSEAEVAKWNEGDDKARAKMLLITGLSVYLYNHSNASNTDLQSLGLLSSNICIRAACSASLLTVLMEDHSSELNHDHIIKILKDNLSDDEFRLAISAVLAELRIKLNSQTIPNLKQVLYSNLTTRWQGDKSLIMRVITVLCGRLPYNNSMEISKNFLAPLVDNSCIFPIDSFSIWQKGVLEKVKFRSVYLNNGSESHGENFVSYSDLELSNTIIKSFGLLNDIEQSNSLSTWIKAIEPIWDIVNQPFGRVAYYSYYHDSAVRIYWVYTLVKLLLNKNLYKSKTYLEAKDFIERYNVKFGKIERFIDNLDFVEIKKLKEIAEVFTTN